MRSGYGGVAAGETPGGEGAYWESQAEDYHARHGATLGDADLLWCPEGLREEAVGLLGDVAGAWVLEVGAGAAQGARWAAGRGARVVALDLSRGMLEVARRLNAAASAGGPAPAVDLIQADAIALPLAADSFDLAFSAMGALSHLRSLGQAHGEVARVLRPGGRWVFSTDHPLNWIFPDSDKVADLRARRRYFERGPYWERDEDGRLTYTHYHHTFADHVSALVGAGFMIEQVIEPEWVDGAPDAEWPPWSQARSEWVPATIIMSARLA
ncbi:MAG: class I SAM-dependent methyltransferase [Bifidobacteriaceae bacterium]|jgi:SAM-dependent methyltransferase|nr:class I SAM-dependent methyltransferase [Bifidobacteriaceae bacterium]